MMEWQAEARLGGGRVGEETKGKRRKRVGIQTTLELRSFKAGDECLRESYFAVSVIV